MPVLTGLAAALALREFPLIGSLGKENSLHPQPTHPSIHPTIHSFIRSLIHSFRTSNVDEFSSGDAGVNKIKYRWSLHTTGEAHSKFTGRDLTQYTAGRVQQGGVIEY